jgi:hypothetical protein
MLRLLVYSYYGIAKVLKSLTGNTERVVRQVIYYPAVNDKATLADLVNRISWYFPQSSFSQVEVSIIVDKKLLGTNLKSLEPPASQECYIGKSENIHLIDRQEVDLFKADVIMLWDKKSMFKPDILRHLTKVYMVDPTYYYTVEADTYRRMYFRTLDGKQKERFIELSTRNYRALLEEVIKYERGYVFGTGPSLNRAMEFNYQDGFRIICNNIVKNKAMLSHINPHVLTFGDAQHHSGPSRYAATFRQTVLETVNEFQYYILIEDFQVPLYLAHFPELENRIIGLQSPGIWDLSLYEILRMVLRNPHKIPWFDKIPGHDEEYNFPTLDKPYVRCAGSVLPTHMLPIASSICKEIYILGADGRDPKGRKPDETYIWSYSSSCQFNNDLMQTAFDTHPSYFRDRPYTEDFDIYCKNFEGLIHYGESLGRKYYSLAPSYIPVLAQRLVPEGILTKMKHNQEIVKQII